MLAPADTSQADERVHKSRHTLFPQLTQIEAPATPTLSATKTDPLVGSRNTDPTRVLSQRRSCASAVETLRALRKNGYFWCQVVGKDSTNLLSS